MNPGNMQGNQFGEFAQPGQAQQKNIEVYAQSMAQQHRVALNNTSSPQGMNSGVQGSPMAQPGLDGQHDMFAGNGPRTMPANGPGAPQQGNHALQDYQMQLMLLEQQNKKRLLMARQEQDNMSGPHQPGAVGAQAFNTGMSPQGNRAVPSPNPADQRNRGTPKLGQQVPGSPMPEGAMQPQRGSPAPGMNFDPNLAPPGMPPQFYQQMPQNPMMRPPSSHPGANFNGQQLTPQQMEAMRNGQMQNGAWRGPPQPGMMPGQQPMGGPMGQTPQQRQMPPPPAPAEQPRPEPSPSQSNQAPPTPSQANKAGPKKKPTKDNKVKLCASFILSSNVDIDCRSPQIRKGQIQVQLRQRQMAKSLPHRLLQLPSPRLPPSISSRSTKAKTVGHSNPYSPSPLLSNSPWITTLLRLAILITT